MKIINIKKIKIEMKVKRFIFKVMGDEVPSIWMTPSDYPIIDVDDENVESKLEYLSWFGHHYFWGTK